ncbi:MAG: InlB B-repeat-containing protein [Bacilli bacterium]
MTKKNWYFKFIFLGILVLLLLSSSGCNKNTYTIDYDVCGGNAIKSEKYELGEVASLPNPTKEGYHFIGWYKDNRYDDGPYTSICINNVEKITLYANWESDAEYEERLIYSQIKEAYLLIMDIPEEYTYKDLDKILAAKLSYESVPDSYKNIVVNGSKLLTILESLDELIALDVMHQIESIPAYITYDFSESIKEIKQTYDSLNDNIKELVTNSSKLLNAYEEIIQIETSNVVIYNLGKYVYRSKEELHQAFFTEYYDFIYRFYPETLETNEITSVEQFLALSLDYNSGRGQMRDFGDRLGQHFLTKDVNGIIENQPETTFIGYCYQNNKFVDIIRFFICYFAYWRIDEKYATTNNYGADFFAESWAPVVDICKYFYYNSITSPVRTARVIDCFNNPAGVAFQVKTDDGMPKYSLRGYTFVGWSDGYQVPNTSNMVYNAVFNSNLDFQYKEEAKLVDIYIYNLTTNKAIRNEITVGYVFDMYNSLPYEARKYVTKTETLENYVIEYEII